MPKPQFIHRRSPEERRQLLQQHSSYRMGEVVGGTTAEVAAVCCCFPCAVVDFMVLTIYKLPAGLCRKAMRRKRRRRLMMRDDSGGGGRDGGGDDDLSWHPAVTTFVTPEADKDVLAFENEMWEKFSESGFWRSPSEDSNLSPENSPELGKCRRQRH